MEKLKLKVTNCYLLPVDSKYLLIDTGYDWEWASFLDKLEYANILISEIAYLLITHHHDDHSGLIKYLTDKNPDIIVIASRKCYQYLKQGKHVHPDTFGHINKRIHFILTVKGKLDKKWSHSFPAYECKDKDIIIDNDISFNDLGLNINGKIITTPGHSIDQISVITDNKMCFCGDAAADLLRFAGTKYALISIDNWNDFYNSWDKIISHDVQTIYPSHGKDFSIDKLKKNLRRCKKENMVKTS